MERVCYFRQGTQGVTFELSPETEEQIMQFLGKEHSRLTAIATAKPWDRNMLAELQKEQ